MEQEQNGSLLVLIPNSMLLNYNTKLLSHKHTQIHLLNIHIEADNPLGSLYMEFLDLTYPFYQFSLYSFFRWTDIPQSLDFFFSPHKVWRKQEVSSKDQREETPVLVWLGPVLPYLFYNDCRAEEAPAIAYPWATKIDNLLWEFTEIVTHQPSPSGRSHWNFNVNNTHFSL